MNEETFNISIRKFLKTVGVGSQREIEQAVGSRAGRRPHPRHRDVPGHRHAARRRARHRGQFDGEIRLE